MENKDTGKTNAKIKVVSGEEWPNDIVVSSERQEKAFLGRILTGFFMVLLVALLIFGMATGNLEIISSILNIALSGIGFACGQAWGRSP